MFEFTALHEAGVLPISPPIDPHTATEVNLGQDPGSNPPYPPSK